MLMFARLKLGKQCYRSILIRSQVVHIVRISEGFVHSALFFVFPFLRLIRRVDRVSLMSGAMCSL